VLKKNIKNSAIKLLSTYIGDNLNLFKSYFLIKSKQYLTIIVK